MNTNNKSDNVFIGSRSLSDNQVKLIVPTFDSILFQIEEIRKQAKNEHRDCKNEYRNKQYNNTIGLFGERGTGKTSSLYTLIKKLQENKKNDIILPIIEPDNFGENSKILGAILGVLKKEVDSIQEEIKKDSGKIDKFAEFYRECRFVENNPLNRSYNEVLEYYCYTEYEYRKLLTQNYTDMETYKKKYSYILNPDLKFGEKLKEFIDALISIKKKDNDEEPLIFLFIDDIDLKTSKCKELIESVMQYTCHPNVVCVLSGDYEILKESITLSLLENEKLSQGNLCQIKNVFNNDIGLVERKKYLANEYLKKILPPAFRHNVVKWNLTNIPKFSFEKSNNNENNKNLEGQNLIYLYEKLNEIFGTNNIFCYEVLDEKYSKINALIKSSYNIFDTTPRGLVNVYYYLSKYNKEEFQKKEELKFVYVKSLIDTLISSSSFLAQYQDNFFKKYLIWGSGESTTTIDFKNIGDKMLEWDEKYKKEDKQENKKNAKEKLKKFLSFFLLGHCVKKLLSNINCSDYNSAKEKFIYTVYSNPWFSDIDIEYQKVQTWDIFKGMYKNEFYNEINRYNAAISDFLKYTDLEFGLVFFEKLRESLNNGDIYINENQDIQLYNEQAFLNIYNILFANEENALNIVISWYKMGYEENGKMKNSIEFLDRMSSQSKSYENTSRIFKALQIESDKEKIIYYTDEEKDFMQESELRRIDKNTGERKVSQIYNGYIKELFIRKLINIVEDNKNISKKDNEEKLNLIEYKNSKTIDSRKLYKLLIKINNGSDNNYNKEKVANYIDKEIKKIGSYINKQIENIIQDNKEIKIKKNTEQICKLNQNGNKTVCKRTFQFLFLILFKNKKMDNEINLMDNEINLEEYIKVIDKLEYLAYRTNAWYGILEARELLKNFKDDSELVLGSEFEEQIAPILCEYSKYRRKNDPLIIENEDLEVKKKKVQKVLRDAFKYVKKEEEIDISSLGLNLEDTEDDLNTEDI